jgi:hypothetical protein
MASNGHIRATDGSTAASAGKAVKENRRVFRGYSAARSENMIGVAVNGLQVEAQFTVCPPDIHRCSSLCAASGTNDRFVCIIA